MAFSKNVTYKIRSAHDPFCEVCNTFLGGNGSFALPWKCECGEYVFDFKKMQHILPTHSKRAKEKS